MYLEQYKRKFNGSYNRLYFTLCHFMINRNNARHFTLNLRKIVVEFVIYLTGNRRRWEWCVFNVKK